MPPDAVHGRGVVAGKTIARAQVVLPESGGAQPGVLRQRLEGEIVDSVETEIEGQPGMEAEQVAQLAVRLGVTELHGGRPVDRLRLAGGQFLCEGELRELREIGLLRLQVSEGDLVDQTSLRLQCGEIERVAHRLEVIHAEARIRQALHPAGRRIQRIQLLNARQVAGEHQPPVQDPQRSDADRRGSQNRKEIRHAEQTGTRIRDRARIQLAAHPGGFHDLHAVRGAPFTQASARFSVQQDHAAAAFGGIFRHGQHRLVRRGGGVIIARFARQLADDRAVVAADNRIGTERPACVAHHFAPIQLAGRFAEQGAGGPQAHQ